jgi:hypothetical protein
MKLYVTEWFCIASFCFFVLVSWLRPLTYRQRLIVFLTGILNISIVLGAAAMNHFFQNVVTTAIRNLIPAVIMVLAYWQSGLFYVKPNLRLQEKLWKMDQQIASFASRFFLGTSFRKWMKSYLELSYLFCYPMVPLGIAIFYFAGQESHATQFWAYVLPPAFICYAMVMFFQTLPPRLLESDFPAETTIGAGAGIRTFNMGIIRHASIQINTFPSAHAAASMAVALAILRFFPVAGWIMVCIAISIAVAAAVQRYHFAADVILGNAIAILWFVILTSAMK